MKKWIKKPVLKESVNEMTKKAITSKQAYKLMEKFGLCFSDDGRTFYATDEEETEVWEFDSKRERDEFINR